MRVISILILSVAIESLKVLLKMGYHGVFEKLLLFTYVTCINLQHTTYAKDVYQYYKAAEFIIIWQQEMKNILFEDALLVQKRSI